MSNLVKTKIWAALSVLALFVLSCGLDDSSMALAPGKDGVLWEGDGEIFDQNPLAHTLMPKSSVIRYEIPHLPELVRPEIIVSIDGLNIILMDRFTGFKRVYPTGVGRLNSRGASITPTGHFATGPNTRDSWWYMPARRVPEYFEGLPFLRITTLNSRGQATYGLHGPTTPELIRGYVSSGCMRMAAQDIIELFWAVRHHPSAPVTIQKEWMYDADGRRIDVGVDFAMWGPHERLPFGSSVGMRPDERNLNVPDVFVGTSCRHDQDCSFGFGAEQGWCYLYKTDGVELEGFCTISCEGYCPDKSGHADTFCTSVDDEFGFCVSQTQSQNSWCENIPGTLAQNMPRYIGSSHAPHTSRMVCLPEEEREDFVEEDLVDEESSYLDEEIYQNEDSEFEVLLPQAPRDQFVGSFCQRDEDCAFSIDGQQSACFVYDYEDGQEIGFCTISCEGFCPDKTGHAATFCVSMDNQQGFCVSQSREENNWCDNIFNTQTRLVSRFIGSSRAPNSSQYVCLPATN